MRQNLRGSAAPKVALGSEAVGRDPYLDFQGREAQMTGGGDSARRCICFI